MAKITYKNSGVDIDAGDMAVELMRPYVKGTFNQNVLTDIGGFGGLFALGKDYRDPVLVSGTDGVGTKLKIAFMMEVHDTVGIDLVAMCADDVVVCGARPLFFLDYIATSRIIPERIAEIVKGMCDGCRMAGMALIGGETAEMPGFYGAGEYDLAGFAVGVVERERIISPDRVKEGDVLIGLASSGLHSNGFSLVRKIMFESCKYDVGTYIPELGKKLGEEMLRPTKIYSSVIMKLVDKYDLHGIAHITGGGLTENVPRVIPEGLEAKIDRESWEVPRVFSFIQKRGAVETEEMYRTFNMGIGMVMVVSEDQSADILRDLKSTSEESYLIGEVGRKG